jgi:hypothetical protein
MYKLREKATGMYYSDPVSAGNGKETNFSWVGNSFSTKKEARTKWLKIIQNGNSRLNGDRYMPSEHEFEIEDLSPKAEQPEGSILLTDEEKTLIKQLCKMQIQILESLIHDERALCTTPDVGSLEQQVCKTRELCKKLK